VKCVGLMFGVLFLHLQVTLLVHGGRTIVSQPKTPDALAWEAFSLLVYSVGYLTRNRPLTFRFIRRNNKKIAQMMLIVRITTTSSTIP
jgi:hypothetical protein